MPNVVRSILAVVAGFVAASVVMLIVESINTHVFYPELGKATGIEDLRALMPTAPAGALLVVIVGWVLGSSLGGYVAAWIGRHAPMRHAIVLGALLTLAGIANNLMIPHPAWFWIPTLLVFVPAAYAGARLAPATRLPA